MLLVVSTAVGEPRRPPNYHHDHMPETSFTCGGKVVGGYYADPDADCQMFHVCVQVDENDVSSTFKFYFNETVNIAQVRSFHDEVIWRDNCNNFIAVT